MAMILELAGGGPDLIQVTAQYSNAVLVALLPYFSDAAHKLDLPVAQPITMQHVVGGGVMPYRYPNGDILSAGIEVQGVRAEQIVNTFDVVTLRAVENFEDILQTAANLVKPGGRIALLIGEDHIPAAKTVLDALKWEEPTQIPNSQRRVVLLGKSPDRT